MKVQVLFLDLTDVSRNLRPNRHLEFLLGEGYSVDVVSLASSDTMMDGARFIQTRRADNRFAVKFFRRLQDIGISLGFFGGISGSYYARILERHLRTLGQKRYELAVVENIFLLPAALRLKNVRAVIFDAREFHPAEFEESLVWRIFRQREILSVYSNDLPKVDRLLTVSPGIQKKFLEEWGLSSDVILNVPDVEPVDRSDSPGEHLRLVYHGLVNHQRGLVEQLAVIENNPGIRFDIYGVGSRRELRKVSERVKAIPNAALLQPVESKAIVSMLSHYDLGLVFYTGKNFNLQAALPNKFFEYIYAGVPPVVAPGTTMANFVERLGFGFVSDDRSVESLGTLLGRISSSDIVRQRANLGSVFGELGIDTQRRNFLRSIQSLNF